MSNPLLEMLGDQAPVALDPVADLLEHTIDERGFGGGDNGLGRASSVVSASGSGSLLKAALRAAESRPGVIPPLALVRSAASRISTATPRGLARSRRQAIEFLRRVSLETTSSEDDDSR